MNKNRNKKFLSGILIALALGAAGSTAAILTNVDNIANNLENNITLTNEINELNESPRSEEEMQVTYNNVTQEAGGNMGMKGYYKYSEAFSLAGGNVAQWGYNPNKGEKFIQVIGPTGNRLHYTKNFGKYPIDSTEKWFQPNSGTMLDDGTLFMVGNETSWISMTPTGDPINWSDYSGLQFNSGNAVHPNGTRKPLFGATQISQDRVFAVGQDGYSAVFKRDGLGGFELESAQSKTFSPATMWSAVSYEENKALVTAYPNTVLNLTYDPNTYTWTKTKETKFDVPSGWTQKDLRDSMRLLPNGNVALMAWNSPSVVFFDPITNSSHYKTYPTTTIGTSRAGIAEVFPINDESLLIYDTEGRYFITDFDGNVMGYDDPMDITNPQSFDFGTPGNFGVASVFDDNNPSTNDSIYIGPSGLANYDNPYSVVTFNYSLKNEVFDIEQTRRNMLDDPLGIISIGTSTYSQIQSSLERNLVGAFCTHFGKENFMYTFYNRVPGTENFVEITDPLNTVVWDTNEIIFTLEPDTTLRPDFEAEISDPVVIEFSNVVDLNAVAVTETSQTKAFIEYDFFVPRNAEDDIMRVEIKEIGSDEVIATKSTDLSSKGSITIDNLTPNTGYEGEQWYISMTYDNPVGSATGSSQVTTTYEDFENNTISSFKTIDDELAIKGNTMTVYETGDTWYTYDEEKHSITLNEAIVPVYGDTSAGALRIFDPSKAFASIKVINGEEITEVKLQTNFIIDASADDKNTLATEYRVRIQGISSTYFDLSKGYQYANLKMYLDGDATKEGIDLNVVNTEGETLISPRLPEQVKNPNKKVYIIVIVVLSLFVIILIGVIVVVIVLEHHFHH